MAGTAPPARLIVRSDRVRSAVWIGALTVAILAVASGVQGLYPTPDELQRAAAIQGDPAQRALNGPAHGLGTLGGAVAFEVWKVALVGVGLMSLLTVGRHTRGEEQSGRAELVRATAVGRHAILAAALGVAASMNLLIGGAVAAGLVVVVGLPAAGALVLATSITAAGLATAGVAGIAAQVTDNTRTVYGMAGAALAGAFVVRGIGDAGDGTLSWFSPLGWAQATRPFAGDRWWPALVLVAFAAALAAVAGAVSVRRDLGAGLIRQRPGPATASAALGRPMGLAWRLQRAGLAGWSIGVALGGLALGAAGGKVDTFAGDSRVARVFDHGDGATLTDAFYATFLVLFALLAAGSAIQATQRPRDDELALRADALLATGMSRRRWAGSHLAVALCGGTVVLTAAGFGAGLGYGAVSRDLGQVPRLVLAAIAYSPAVWVLAAVTAAVFGVWPRALSASWLVLASCLAVGLFGRLLGLPRWIIDLSPFEHIPRLAASGPSYLPSAVLIATAVLLAGIGLAAVARRDIGQ